MTCRWCRYLVIIAAFATLAANMAVAVEMAEPKDVPPLFAEGEARTVEEWRDVRRPAVKKLLESEVYGRRPVERPPHLVFSALEPDAVMMDGAAVRRARRRLRRVVYHRALRLDEYARMRRVLRGVSPRALARAGCAAEGRRRKRVVVSEVAHCHAVALAEEFLRMVLAAETAALAYCRDRQ